MGWVARALALFPVCGLALISCESAPTPEAHDPPASKPGTRLSAIVLEVEGVRTPPLRWFDKLLNVECDFYEAGDKYRCLPDSAWIVYADPACTQPLLEIDDSVPDYTPVVGLGDEAFGHCGETLEGKPITLRAFMAGKSLPPQTIYGPFDCEPSDSSQTLHEIVEEMPMGRFVSAKSVRVPIEGRFDGKVLYADDGARDFYALYDKQLGTDVSAWLGVYQPTYTADMVDGFSDEACTQSLGLVGTGCSAEYGTQNFEYDGCTATADLWKLGKQVADRGYLQAGDDNICQTTYYPAWEAKKQVPWSSLVAADRRVDGDGRIRTVWDTAVGGKKDLRWGGFYDAKLGTDCSPTRITTGVSRCAPHSAWSWEFLDSTCSTPIVDETGCVDVMESFRGQREGFFRVTDTVEIDHHYEQTYSDGCQRVEDEGGKSVLVGGARIPYENMATYVRLTLDEDTF